MHQYSLDYTHKTVLPTKFQNLTYKAPIQNQVVWKQQFDLQPHYCSNHENVPSPYSYESFFVH